MADTTHTIEVASIYGFHTKQGLVELTVDGNKIQMDVRKAREVIDMLYQATEAAISDEVLMKFLIGKLDLTIESAGAMLLEFREIRQGSRRTVYIQ